MFGVNEWPRQLFTKIGGRDRTKTSGLEDEKIRRKTTENGLELLAARFNL